ncbi:MAG: PPOX class F420-dependent enzyme [Dehalococcoidia bacterium]|nr:MAG: PPOX class F420-dependent enzyme [Dehalococcoidia bacterium]
MSSPTQLQPLTAGMVRLAREPSFAQLATINPDGSPQLSQVWVDTDGQYLLVNTAAGRQKVRNVRRDPRVALQVIDPRDAYRLFVAQGRVVEITTVGADEHIDRLAQKYLGQERYPWRRPGEQRLILKIAPERIRTGATPLD